MSSFETLEVWKKSIELVQKTYILLNQLPFEEDRNIADQIRRSVVSISLNIAEGSACTSSKDYKRYIQIAKNSATETLAINKIISFLYPHIDTTLTIAKTEEIIRMLIGLYKYLDDI